MRISDWSSDVCSSDLHGPDGQPYDDLAEMSRRAIAAAEVTGIGITQLPVLYGYGGFGAQKAGEGQRRFLNDPSRLLQIGRASCRERVCQYVSISVVAVS